MSERVSVNVEALEALIDDAAGDLCMLLMDRASEVEAAAADADRAEQLEALDRRPCTCSASLEGEQQ